MRNEKKIANLVTEVSHEFRTPLNSIIGFSDMIKSEIHGPLPEKYIEYAHSVHESALFMLELVSEILNPINIAAVKTKYSPKKFDASEVILGIVKILKPLATKKNVIISTNIEEVLLPVFLDKTSLNQIMFNLISNAIKFSSCGGSIKISGKIDNDSLIISVQDFGKGLEGDYNFNEGKGLGLFIVKSLLEQQFGKLEMRSKKDIGTKAVITLPFNMQL